MSHSYWLKLACCSSVKLSNIGFLDITVLEDWSYVLYYPETRVQYAWIIRSLIVHSTYRELLSWDPFSPFCFVLFFLSNISQKFSNLLQNDTSWVPLLLLQATLSMRTTSVASTFPAASPPQCIWKHVVAHPQGVFLFGDNMIQG